MTAQKVKREHFLVVKKSGFAADGRVLSARASTEKLLDAGFWPLWKNTRCKHMIESGNRLLFYIAGAEPGCRSVIARAVVESVDNWTDKAFKRNYPLMLDGEPDKVIRLSNICHLRTPVDLLTVLDRLSFIPENRNKWGVAMMGGVRSLTAEDYNVLKGANLYWGGAFGDPFLYAQYPQLELCVVALINCLFTLIEPTTNWGMR